MMLLSADDKALLVLEHLGPAALAGDTMSLYDCFQSALAVAEKALLAKLAEKPLAYFYHDASCPEMANPLLHSTLLLHVDDRNSNLKNETPLYTRRQAND